MDINKDCFGVTEGGKCKVLTIGKCEGYHKCPFFKTIKQYEADRKKYGEVEK